MSDIDNESPFFIFLSLYCILVYNSLDSGIKKSDKYIIISAKFALMGY